MRAQYSEDDIDNFVFIKANDGRSFYVRRSRPSVPREQEKVTPAALDLVRKQSMLQAVMKGVHEVLRPIQRCILPLMLLVTITSSSSLVQFVHDNHGDDETVGLLNNLVPGVRRTCIFLCGLVLFISSLYGAATRDQAESTKQANSIHPADKPQRVFFG